MTTRIPTRATRGIAAALGVAIAMTASDALAQGDAARAAQLAQGKQLVSTVCAACHTEQPPPKLAPPLSHVSRRYRMLNQGDRDKALARIVAWIKAPAKEKSLMPAMAIERFGLMAPLPLPDSQLQAAAAYVWSLSEGDSTMGGGMGNMRGMQHGHMADTSKMKDTTTLKRP
ncbi:MAG: cytochrome c [Gemmatimonadaceae bacterium]|nr:cytochrome c [Gemmatimonadaceae bacterium]